MSKHPSALTQDFLAEVEAFLLQRRLRPTTFGREVMGDPGFVAALKKGRCPTLRTIEFVRTHIAQEARKPEVKS